MKSTPYRVDSSISVEPHLSHLTTLVHLVDISGDISTLKWLLKLENESLAVVMSGK